MCNSAEILSNRAAGARFKTKGEYIMKKLVSIALVSIICCMLFCGCGELDDAKKEAQYVLNDTINELVSSNSNLSKGEEELVLINEDDNYYHFKGTTVILFRVDTPMAEVTTKIDVSKEDLKGKLVDIESEKLF